MAAAIAPTPRMIGVDIWEKTREDEVSGSGGNLAPRHVQTEQHNRVGHSSGPPRTLESEQTQTPSLRSQDGSAAIRWLEHSIPSRRHD